MLERDGRGVLIVRLAEWKSIMIFNAQMGAITVKRADKRILHLIYCCLARLLIVYVYYVPLCMCNFVCLFARVQMQSKSFVLFK